MNRLLQVCLVAILLTLPITVCAQGSSTFMFGGDVMLGRAVRDQIVKLGKNDGGWVTQNIAAEFKKADLAFVNLESPFAPGPALNADMIFRADPRHITALTNAGIDVVSLANNHERNQGAIGISTTIDTLRKNNIQYSGAGKTEKDAYAPAIIETKNIKIAVLSYTYNEHIQSNKQIPTVASMDTTILKAEVKKAKARGCFVVISMHAGNEYTLTPNMQQKRFARAAIDAGADLVIGHHPHWVQRIEKYRGKPIVYSLGNLVFDQPWSKATQQGAAARVTVRNKKVFRVEILPVKIERASQPHFMTKTEAQEVLNRIGLPTGEKYF